MLPAAKLLLSTNGRHSMTSIHCAKSPDLKPIDNLRADIKPDLSRNTQRNVIEFEITIHAILNQIPTKRSSQCLVGSRTVSILVVAIPAMMLFFVVLLSSVVIDFIVDIFAVDVCYLEKCYLQYKFCLNVTKHGYCF